VPKGQLVSAVEPIALTFPVAAKLSGEAHKTEAGGVILNIQNEAALETAINSLIKTSKTLLIEEMMDGPFTELIVGAAIDDTGIWTLTIGAGGVLTELLEDSVTLTLPTSEDIIESGLKSLKVYKLLHGYRGQDGADINTLIQVIKNIAQYVENNKETLLELDINPLAAGPKNTMALDALMIERTET